MFVFNEEKRGARKKNNQNNNFNIRKMDFDENVGFLGIFFWKLFLWLFFWMKYDRRCFKLKFSCLS